MVTSSDTADMDTSLDALGMLTQHIPDPEMQGQRMLLNTYLRSAAFKRKLQAIASRPHKLAILINAGGRMLLTNLVTTLKTDNATLSSLDHYFGPVYGFSVKDVTYPQHHRRIRLGVWEAKVFSLLHCRFQEVLKLDSDNTPLRDACDLFQDVLYIRHGNMFWPDFWSHWIS
eukprot:jgi/Chrzof1/13951/Cz08g19050.t1